MDEQSNVRYIGAEEESYEKQEDSFEQIILKQIRHCSDLLSKDVNGITYKETNSGIRIIPTKNLTDEIDNSINTLEKLLDNQIGDFREKINEIKEETNEKIKELGEKKIRWNKKEVKVKDVVLERTHEVMKEKDRIINKANREIFRILINVYNKNKSLLRELENE